MEDDLSQEVIEVVQVDKNGEDGDGEKEKEKEVNGVEKEQKENIERPKPPPPPTKQQMLIERIYAENRVRVLD